MWPVYSGQGSFNWTVAERAAKQGFAPDIISSDLHIGGVNGIVYDLPTCLTKFLAMGMPLPEVVRAATATPVRWLLRLSDPSA
jgi:dihydroorotase